MATFTFGGAPPPEVSSYFADKTLRPAFRSSEVWGQEHAYSFTVAKATQLDVLGAIKDSLRKAIDQGVPYSAWSKTLQPELERLGWWGVKDVVDPATGEIRPAQLGSPRRLQTIYDANLRSARAAGQWDRAQRTKAVLPYFSYQLGPSIHHRPEHEAREGMIAPVDSPIWDAWYPPNGWGCKCWLQQITRSAAMDAGGPTDFGNGHMATRTFTRRRDDGSQETVKVPKGIDPGWANNPGKNRAATLMDSLAGKLEAAGPDVARAVIADLWSGPVADVLPNIPQRFFAPVAVAPPALKAALKTPMGASSDVVMVASDTMATKLGKHGKGRRGLSPADFGKVQEMLDRGHAVDGGDGRRLVVAKFDDGWWSAVFKTDRTRRELILVTLHPVLARRAKTILER